MVSRHPDLSGSTRLGRAVGDCSVAACPLGSFRLSAARLWSSVSWHYSLGRLCHQVPGSVPALSPLSCDLEFWPRYCVWHCALRSLPHRLSALGQAVACRSFKRSLFAPWTRPGLIISAMIFTASHAGLCFFGAAAARTRVVNHSRSSGESMGPGLCPRPLGGFDYAAV